MLVFSSSSRKSVLDRHRTRAHCSTELRSDIQAWVQGYSNNKHKGFSDYARAVDYFEEHLAQGQVIDKNGVVERMDGKKPVYVPGSVGLALTKPPTVPPPSNLASPY